MSHEDRHIERNVRRHAGPKLETFEGKVVAEGSRVEMPAHSVARLAESAAKRVIQIDAEIEKLNEEKAEIEKRIEVLKSVK